MIRSVVDSVLNSGAVFLACEAVLGREQRGEIDACLAHQVDIAAALAIETGLIGDQTDALALQGLEAVCRQNIEAGKRFGVAAYVAVYAGRGESFVITGEGHALHRDSHRGGGDGGDFRTHRSERRTRRGVDAVREQNHVGLGGGVDPDGRAGEAGMAERADGKQLAAVAGKRRIDIPAEASQDGLVGRTLRLGELLNGERIEETDAIEFAAVEHHLREAGQVVGGGKKPGVSGHASHVARGGVVNHAAQRNAGGGQTLGGRDSRNPRGGRKERGGLHAQRLEDILARIVVQHLAAQPMHQFAQQDEVDVAIDEAGSRRPGGRIRAGQVDAGLVAAPRHRQRHVRLQPGKMREEIADGDVAFPALKFGNVLRDLVIQLKLALLEQLHQRRRGGDHLGQRRQIEHGIERHGLCLRNQRPVAIGFPVNDLAIVADNQHRSRETFLRDRLSDDIVGSLRSGEGLG